MVVTDDSRRGKMKALRGVSLLWAVILVVLALLTLGAPVAGAKEIGHFKVLGGHVKQSVDYIASYKLDDSSGCWRYHYNDQGGARYDLKVNTFKTPMWGNPSKVVALNLFYASGTASRRWSGTVSQQRLKPSDYYYDRCPRANPPTQGATSCGSKDARGRQAVWMMVRTGRNDATPFTTIFRRDPFHYAEATCPSDSVYGTTTVYPAPAPHGFKKILEAKPGDRFRLSGDVSVRGPGPNGFFVPFDWVGGSQTAQLDWALQLKRVRG